MREKLPQPPVLFVFLFALLISCQKYDEISYDEDTNEIIDAKFWYESNYSPELLIDAKGLSQRKLIAKPDWDRARCFKHPNSITVEVPLIFDGEFGIASEECYQAFKESDDKRYISSQTTLVVEKKNDQRIAFLMTIIPDMDYKIAKQFEVFSSSYKKWDRDFCGIILYHNLNGIFSNGWWIKDGLVIDPIIIHDDINLPLEMSKSECYAWYYITWTEICDNTITKGCVRFETWYYLGTTCDGGGGGGGFQAVDLNRIYASSSNLSPTQKSLLQSALNTFATSHSIYANIWQNMIENNVKLVFKIKPDLGHAAAISEDGSTIFFRSTNDIKVQNLTEELIHKHQMIEYGPNFDGLQRNFEFEAKVLQDIINNMNGNFGASMGSNGLSPELGGEYCSWIYSIAQSGTSFDIVNFNYYCSRFHYSDPPGNYYYPFFEPELLFFYSAYGFHSPGDSIIY
jgi:hypothetical protein